MKNPWPEYGFHIDVAHGVQPDECVLMLGAPSDCLYGHTSPGRLRKSPHTCKWWRKVATPPTE